MVVCLLFTHPVKLAPLVEACYRFTPRLAIRQEGLVIKQVAEEQLLGDALFLHLTEEPSRLLISKLRHLSGRFGLRDHQIGWGTAAPQALARARYDNAILATLPVRALLEVATPFKKDDEKEKPVAEMVELLRRLGLFTIGDFKKLPLAGLSARFGELAVQLWLTLHEKREEPWPALILPENISEEVDLEERELFVPLETLEPILFLMREVIDRVLARLHGRNERAVGVALEFECQRGSLSIQRKTERRRWEIHFPVPQKSLATIFSILREKLYFELPRHPLSSPVTLIRLSVLSTAPGTHRQKDFFHHREEEQEMWSSLVARLCQKLGEAQVFSASLVSRHLPEKAWSAQLKDLAEAKDQAVKYDGANAQDILQDEELAIALADGFWARRPTRLLAAPEVLTKQGDWLISPNRRWKVVAWEGPERISGEWWSADHFSRDYYRVFTDQGEQLWIYFAGGIYLHGFFD